MKGKALFRVICLCALLITAICFITCSRLNMPDYLEGNVGRFGYGTFDEKVFGE